VIEGFGNGMPGGFDDDRAMSDVDEKQPSTK
jgi:hypothetical protein